MASGHLDNLVDSESPLSPPAPETAPWPTEALLFTQLPVEEALKHQTEALEKILADADDANAIGQHQMLMLEHPQTYVLGPGVEESALDWTVDDLSPDAALPDGHSWNHNRREDFHLLHSDQARGIEYYGPGQLAVYLTVNLDRWRKDADAVATVLEDVILATLAGFGIQGERQKDGRAIRVHGAIVATIRTRVRRAAAPSNGHSTGGDRWVAAARLTIHTNTDPAPLSRARDAQGAPEAFITMAALGVPVERQEEVREAVLNHYTRLLGSPLRIPQRDELRTTKPPWLKARIPFALGTEKVHGIISDQRLHTVCESAHCPNMGECWRHGTATFMINGNICTRSCSFCAIYTGRPQTLDRDEPRRVAEAAALMGIKYVVVTSVNRDELPDGGACNFVDTIRLLRERIADVHIEVLIPDFRGVAPALDAVFAARPDVLNHNIETVPRLYKRVRPQARYQRSLDVISRAKAAGLLTKSGFMLGLGEEDTEVEQTLRDLRAHHCDIVTIGQYLRPSEKHHPLIRYVTPAEFDHWKTRGLELGFEVVESGPLVRSSYHAHQSFQKRVQ